MVLYLKKNKEYFFSFLIPLLFLCLLFLCLFMLVPNGYSVLISDMSVQYDPLLTYFKNHGFEIFSFYKGFGSSMIGTFAYYLSSPFNLILFLFPNDKTDIAILILIILKMSLSGLTMFLYLKDEVKVENKLYLLIFSTSYALMGFHVAYFFHIMWLDATMILPIVILGINKLFNGKSKIYILSLFYAIISNYYMGYMICIFSFLYFVYKLLLNYDLKKDKKEILKKFRKFIICSLLAAGLSLFFLLPSILELSQISKNNISPYANKIKITNPFKVLSFLFIEKKNISMMITQKVYNIYFGTVNLVLLFFYFLNNKISKKERKLSFIMVLIFALSIFINYADYVWHGFSATSGFAARYLFISTFFNLMLCAKSFIKIKEIKLINYYLFLIMFIVLSIVTIFGRYTYIDNYILIANNVLVIFYLILLYYFDRLPIKKNLILFLIMVLCFSELFFNFYIGIRKNDFMTREETEEIYHTFNNQLKKIKKNDHDFYRIAKDYDLTGNDSFRFNTYSVSHFLSTIHNKSLSFLGYNGYSIGSNFAGYSMPNPVADSIIGNKYLFLKDTDRNLSHYEKTGKYQISKSRYELYNLLKQDIIVYKNPYAFSLGMLVNENTGTCQIDYHSKDLA